MALSTLYVGAASDAVDHADHAVAAAEVSGDAERLSYALAGRALAGVLASDDGYRLFVERALELERRLETSLSVDSPTYVAAQCARFTFDVDEARLRIRQVLERAADDGNVVLEWEATSGLARMELLAGDPRRAGDLADLALELGHAMGKNPLPEQIFRAEIDAHVGRSSDAYAVLRDEYERAWLRENRPYWLHNVLARFDLTTQRWIERADRVNLARQQWYRTRKLPGADAIGIPASMPGLADSTAAAAKATSNP
jgi:hypothetical protein